MAVGLKNGGNLAESLQVAEEVASARTRLFGPAHAYTRNATGLLEEVAGMLRHTSGHGQHQQASAGGDAARLLSSGPDFSQGDQVRLHSLNAVDKTAIVGSYVGSARAPVEMW